MTEVAFHFNAPDRLQYAARLLRKALARGHRLLVLADPDDLAALDTLLWTLEPGSFIPHALPDDSDSVRLKSPVLLASQMPPASSADVLVNLQPRWVEAWSNFPRVIEVVSQDEQDRLAARERWRLYRQQGIEPVRHDLSARTT